MGPAVASVSSGMDRAWLEDQARHDPVMHAYALWDLDYAPDRVEFRVLREGGVPVAYLLIWHGNLGTVVHWVGSDRPDALLDALPPRPLIAVVPEPVGEAVCAARAPARTYRIRVMSRAAGAVPSPVPDPRIRRLRSADVPELQGFAARADEWVRRGYTRPMRLDDPPIPEAIWGAFDGPRIVGVASTHVKRASVWIIGGVYVDPAHRNQGLGRALTAAAVAEADATGAATALFVRDDNAPAVRAYERVGFRTLRYRTWVDAGAERAP
ncbi:MAG TPA: GNAT family N-acetyltransferase [Thermoplasmata archaeon]|nr:GNAT family N-acetyltransferase [Thermoplasmata archaeon]